MAPDSGTSSPFYSQIKLLFQGAIVIFLATVIIGILNGLNLVEFTRPQLLTHAHAGTLGWITLGVFGATLWFFSAETPATPGGAQLVRWLSILAIVVMALYVLTFYLANKVATSITGSLALLVILGFFGWVLVQSRQVRFTVPHLAMLAALATLAVGAVLGVLLQLQLAGAIKFLPQGAFGSHPATMVAGYLILAGMAITEWGLRRHEAPAPLRWLGMAQVALPFLGGLSLMVGALLDIFLLTVLIAPLQIVGVLIYLGRVGSRILRVPWWEGSNHRLFALSALYLVVNVALIAYLVVTYADRIEEIPPWLIFALDHSVFIGVMTNGLFGLIYLAALARRTFWPWVDHVLFWGMNAGLVGFVAGLILQDAILKQVFTPIMGTSILLTMLAYTVRLQTRAPVPSPQRA